ncbi:hypothetical protein H4219_001365 [Mycoemilia scoparia]|uniref:MPN domain-containing protein n=1 Tax=Mycoemilia scoparia TaxID=417184 RepID=A0A9W8A0P0_9FUNG|nr:hypothetical protein H4219_001365 [Mycoemilia scoparia]
MLNERDSSFVTELEQQLMGKHGSGLDLEEFGRRLAYVNFNPTELLRCYAALEKAKEILPKLFSIYANNDNSRENNDVSTTTGSTNPFDNSNRTNNTRIDGQTSSENFLSAFVPSTSSPVAVNQAVVIQAPVLPPVTFENGYHNGYDNSNPFNTFRRVDKEMSHISAISQPHLAPQTNPKSSSTLTVNKTFVNSNGDFDIEHNIHSDTIINSSRKAEEPQTKHWPNGDIESKRPPPPPLPPRPKESEYSSCRPIPPPLPPKPLEYSPLIDTDIFESTASAISNPREPLRTITIPDRIVDDFIKVAEPNTERNLETCAIICGVEIDDNNYHATSLIIPKQHATSDSCTTENEEEVTQVLNFNNLISLGWIHTHPTQTCFMSSLDLHTHCSYQLMLPEAIAIVCAPKSHPHWGVFRLTEPHGLNLIKNCREPSPFHPHDQTKPLYNETYPVGHVVMSPCELFILDLRY